METKKEEVFMIEIGRTLVSIDVAKKEFICNIKKCKGICCIEGDSGAPVEDDEIDYLEQNIDNILPYLSEKGKEAIIENGVHYIDIEKDKVTTLINGSECAFTIFEDGIAQCGIEKAWADGKIEFRKPISCHLYPIRIAQYKDFDAVNYDSWDICSDACELGKKESVKVYEFLKEPLIRKYGNEWYKELAETIKQIDLSKF